MKEKNVAGILALFLGVFGVHRFYLNQTGMGIFYLIFCWLPIMWIVAVIDAIAFFSMDEDDFDRKYNKVYDPDRRRRDYDRRRNAYGKSREEVRERRREERYQSRRRPNSRQYEPRTTYSRPKPKAARPKENPYKQSGIKKYKDFDYDGAIEDFQRALKISPDDIATHFNLACAYSLNEETEKSFYHLDRAVQLGFTDFGKIKEHDALAYIRIQDGFDAFEKNDFRLPASPLSAADTATTAPDATTKSIGPSTEEGDLLSQEPDLLDQLKRLGELRDKGLLTEAEFTSQKKKLLND
jgi:TM2 domain-containing membrane protein YozV